MQLKTINKIYILNFFAILALVIFNANLEFNNQRFFKGGYIGLNIIIVITGYLTTFLILKKNTNKIIVNYYKNLITIILPPLLILICFTLVLSWFFLLPENLYFFTKSIFSSITFISNFLFYSTGNTPRITSDQPLLHTWILSLLIQLYLFLPLAILFIKKNFKKHFLKILIILFILSIYSAYNVEHDSNLSNIFLPKFYIWQYFFGSLIAYTKINFDFAKYNSTYKNFFSLIGLISIITYVFIFDYFSAINSKLILIPIIGIFPIIIFLNSQILINKLLYSKFFLYLSSISYCLYLFHYPIFSFVKISGFATHDFFKKIIVFFVILFFSILTSYFIEKPIKNKNYKFSKILFFIIIFYIFLISMCLLIIKNEGFKNRFPELLRSTSNTASWLRLTNDKNENCFEKLDGCRFNEESNKKIYLIGDSHAATLNFDLKNILVDKDYQFISFTSGNCIYFPGFTLFNKNTNKKLGNCNNDYFIKIKEILKKEKNAIILFVGRWPLYLNEESFLYQFNNDEKILKLFKNQFSFKKIGNYSDIQDSFKIEVSNLKQNNIIVLVYPIPEVGFTPKDQILKNWINKRDISKVFENDFKDFELRSSSSFNLLDSIEGKNIYRVYPHEFFCNNIKKNKCITHDNKNIFYIDNHHLSHIGSKEVSKLILNKLEEITINTNE